MNKDQLANELRQKLKLGIKPSDLKKQGKNNQLPTPPASPIIKPIDQKTQLKPSKTSISSSPIEIKKIKQLQEQVNFHANTANTYLLNLQATMAKLDAAELTNQDLQEKNEKLNKTIQALQNQTKSTGEPQPNETKTFLCSDCQQSKPQTELSRQFNNFSFCLTCSKKARQTAQQEKTEPTNFTCHACQQTKQEMPNKMKLDQALQTYLICSPCRPTLKEFNEADLITDELWAKYPYSSASEILAKEFNIKKEEPW